MITMKITRKQLRKLINEALKFGDYEIPTPLPPGAVGSKETHRRRSPMIDAEDFESISKLGQQDPNAASSLSKALGSEELDMLSPQFGEKHKHALARQLFIQDNQEAISVVGDIFSRLHAHIKQKLSSVRMNDKSSVSRVFKRLSAETQSFMNDINKRLDTDLTIEFPYAGKLKITLSSDFIEDLTLVGDITLVHPQLKQLYDVKVVRSTNPLSAATRHRKTPESAIEPNTHFIIRNSRPADSRFFILLEIRI